MAMLKLCRCGKPMQLTDKQCVSCEQANGGVMRKESNRNYDKHRRDKQSKGFYDSKEWRKVRLIILQRDRYMCVKCYLSKRIVSADVVDHIVPIKEDWSKRLKLNNLQSLCHACHNKKTKEDSKVY